MAPTIRLFLFSVVLAALFHASVAAATTSAKPAIGTVRISNFLSQPVHISVVCGSYDISPHIIPAGGFIIVPFPREGIAHACSAKANLVGNIPQGAPIMQYEYSVSRGEVWWNLSAQDGDPFLALGSGGATWGGNAATSTCPRQVICPPGNDAQCSFQGRNPWGPVFHCTIDTNLQFYLGQAWD